MQRLQALQKCDSRIIKLMAYLDAIHEWVLDDSFYGCSFINAGIEFKLEDEPIHIAALNHQNSKIQFFQELLTDLHLPDVTHVARSLHLLIEGAIIRASTFNDFNAALHAKDTILILLNSYLISPPLELIENKSVSI